MYFDVANEYGVWTEGDTFVDILDALVRFFSSLEYHKVRFEALGCTSKSTNQKYQNPLWL